MSKLRISPAARMTATDDGILIGSDLGTFQLHGADVKVFAGVIGPLLDGSRDADQVAAAVTGYSRSSVLSFLELLRQRGLLESLDDAARGAGPAAGIEPQERFFQAFALDPQATTARLRNAKVLLAGAEPWGAAAALELAAAGVGAIHLAAGDQIVSPEDLLALRAFGAGDLGRPRRDALREAILRQSPACAVTGGPLAEDKKAGLKVAGGPFSLLIAALGGDDLFGLQRVARFAHAAGLPSLYGHLDGFESWVGPVVMPGQTACWNCLRLRRLAVVSSHTAGAKAAHDLDAAGLKASPPPRARAFLAPMAAQNGLALAMEALKLLAGYGPSQLLGRFQVSNLVSQETSFHQVVPMPWCEVCGGAAAILEQLPPESRPVALLLDQLADLQGLRQVLAGWADARVGVIHNLNGPSADAGIALPATASAYLAAYTEGKIDPGTAGQLGSGKGVSSLQAHIGAAGEAIERYSAARYRLDRLKVSSFYDLKAEKIDPRRLSLYDDRQYSQPGFPFQRFSTKKPIHWVEGRWLDTGFEGGAAGGFGPGGKVWVPALVAYFNFQPPSPADYFCQVSSNGLAAGSSLEDAAVRATFELIERDAAMLTWLCRLKAPRIELDASLDAGSWQAISQLAARGVPVEAYLLDVGVGIPTVFCVGYGDGRSWPGVTVSLATHTDPRRAAAKAILEQAHVGPYLASLLPTAKVPGSFAEVLTLEDHAAYYFPPERQAAFDFLRSGGLQPVRLADLPDAGPATVRNCSTRLAAAGLRVAIVDVTSPDVAFSPFRVARAVGIDMLPIHFGSYLRRLGNPRLKKLLGEGQLHPHPHPIA
jgi:ribosomal protein S12 methylthiotransferase accessory factor